MAKKFNVTGTCFREDHYMADVTKKVNSTFKMVEKGEYFVINRPRQYGKTTTLYTMAERMNESQQYHVFSISFEGIGDEVFKKESAFSQVFVKLLAKSVKKHHPKWSAHIQELIQKVEGLETLGETINYLASETDKKLVLLIDEVDKSSNYPLFLGFLALLRNLYLDRKTAPTFHSIVLAGVHDVKSLKLKIRRPDETTTYNSPWNIATDYLVNMNLSPSEIKPMLDEYALEEGISMDSQAISERLFYFTSGYPFLTSYMCKIIAEEMLPETGAKTWTNDDVNKAFRKVIERPNNANFDTLVKNLKEFPDLHQLVYSLVIDGEYYPFNQQDATISLGVLHGIFAKAESGELMIHNRIYREIIAEMMISEWRTGNLMDKKNYLDDFNGVTQYKLPNNELDFHRVLVNFQEFMRQNYSSKDRNFLERDGRLIFLAYLKPVINGIGYDFKEPQISEERRLDVVITYLQHKYLVELKLWKGQVAHEKGLLQLADYLDRQGLSTGYLLIFDHNKKKFWKKDWVDVEGKRIFWVRV